MAESAGPSRRAATRAGQAMNSRGRKQRGRYLREIETAATKAFTPEAEREAALVTEWCLEEERWDERNFLIATAADWPWGRAEMQRLSIVRSSGFVLTSIL